MPPIPTRRHGLAAARRIAVELTPQTVEQIASRVAQLMRHQQTSGVTSPAGTPGWMTAKELAAHLKLNPAWVYEHAQELGAIRTGTGPKARIRFDLHTATQALKHHQQPAAAAAAATPRRKPTPRPAPYPTDAPLLEIRDPYPRSTRGCTGRTRLPRRLGVS
jgi:pyruvate/2-oxoglutarate dehydrogenase complex dihydrolipoamide acyltransferase (E2) component